MIRSVTAINFRGESLKLEPRDARGSGFQIQDISGLGPPKATINTTKRSNLDGDVFNSALAENRNVVLSLGLLNAPTIEEVRHKSYRYFPLKKPVDLIIETDTRIVATYGYVESNQPSIFTNEPTQQISIICPDSFLYDAGPNKDQETVFYGIEPRFEFPFSNESLTEPLLEFSSIQSLFQRTIIYDGDVEVGLSISVVVSGPVQNLVLYDTDTNESLRIDSSVLTTMTGADLNTGDRILISTTPGRKSAFLLRNGVYTNILNALGRNPNWLMLQKGSNSIAYYADEGLNNVQISIENMILYEGI